MGRGPGPWGLRCRRDPMGGPTPQGTGQQVEKPPRPADPGNLLGNVTLQMAPDELQPEAEWRWPPGPVLLPPWGLLSHDLRPQLTAEGYCPGLGEPPVGCWGPYGGHCSCPASLPPPQASCSRSAAEQRAAQADTGHHHRSSTVWAALRLRDAGRAGAASREDGTQGTNCAEGPWAQGSSSGCPKRPFFRSCLPSTQGS